MDHPGILVQLNILLQFRSKKQKAKRKIQYQNGLTKAEAGPTDVLYRWSIEDRADAAPPSSRPEYVDMLIPCQLLFISFCMQILY